MDDTPAPDVTVCLETSADTERGGEGEGGGGEGEKKNLLQNFNSKLEESKRAAADVDGRGRGEESRAPYFEQRCAVMTVVSLEKQADTMHKILKEALQILRTHMILEQDYTQVCSHISACVLHFLCCGHVRVRINVSVI